MDAKCNGGPAGRGRHTIFLGYVVGAGKTHAMLAEARDRADRGEDVVVGYLEPHVRPETRALAEGLEVVAPRSVDYRGSRFTDLDTAAIIARRPALVLVDELAHTNLPGDGHDKRWQSVEELLDAGIGIFSTVNVQHVESVAPTASQILGAPVREIVPNEVVEQAYELRFVDIEPDELIQRAKDGQLYPADEIGPALTHVLRRANLVALREEARRLVRERRGSGSDGRQNRGSNVSR